MNGASDSRFVTRKQNIVKDQTNVNDAVENEIIYSIEVLKSNHCSFTDAYLLVRNDITILSQSVTQVVFKICGPVTKYITKTYGTTIARLILI